MFKQKDVPEKILLEILEAGTWAPSHGNNQPWEFMLIGSETRAKLTSIYKNHMEEGPLKDPALPPERKQLIRNFMQNFGNAPVLLAVVSLPAKTDLDKYDFPMSTAAAIQNIFLSAWEKQVAGVWLSFGMNPKVRSLLEIPEDGKIAGILVLGYPEVVPPVQPRTAVSDKLRRLP